jgi:hypothetical protein
MFLQYFFYVHVIYFLFFTSCCFERIFVHLTLDAESTKSDKMSSEVLARFEDLKKKISALGTSFVYILSILQGFGSLQCP